MITLEFAPGVKEKLLALQRAHAAELEALRARLARFESFADWVYYTRLDRKKIKRMARAMVKGVS